MSRSVSQLLELTKTALLEEAAALGLPVDSSNTKLEISEAILNAEAAKAGGEEGSADQPEDATDVIPEEPVAAAPQGEDASKTQRVADVLADIRHAFHAVKKVNYAEGDEAIQKAVEAQLTPEERRRVQWGGSTTRHVVG
jgi:hypothetical protein